MEKDQNINIENQNEEVKKAAVEDKNNHEDQQEAAVEDQNK